MACACKVNQQLDYLHKKYGDNQPKNKKTNIRDMVTMKAEALALVILAIPLMPVIIVYIIAKTISGKPIHIDKFVRKKKDE